MLISFLYCCSFWFPIVVIAFFQLMPYPCALFVFAHTSHHHPLPYASAFPFPSVTSACSPNVTASPSSSLPLFGDSSLYGGPAFSRFLAVCSSLPLLHYARPPSLWPLLFLHSPRATGCRSHTLRRHFSLTCSLPARSSAPPGAAPYLDRYNSPPPGYGTEFSFFFHLP